MLNASVALNGLVEVSAEIGGRKTGQDLPANIDDINALPVCRCPDKQENRSDKRIPPDTAIESLPGARMQFLVVANILDVAFCAFPVAIRYEEAGL